MKEKSYDWTPLQIAGARTIHMLKKDFEPKCPSCEVGVLRPKCLYESEECPRHEIASNFEDMLRRIKELHDLPRNFHLELDMPLFFRVGPPSYNTFKLLCQVLDRGGFWEFPIHMDGFKPLERLSLGHWSAKGNVWTFRLSHQIYVYMNDFAMYERDLYVKYTTDLNTEAKGVSIDEA